MSRLAVKPVPKTYVDMSFPLAGMDTSRAFYEQKPRQMFNGDYGRTTPLGINVRSYEALTGRGRGGSRPGLAKYIATAGATGKIQHLSQLVGAGYTPPGGITQSSDSGRVVSLIKIIAGNLYVASAGGSSWVSPTNNTATPPFKTDGLIHSASINQKMWYPENRVVYDPALNSLARWDPTIGSFPESNGETPRLIKTWRGRAVVSGILSDPHNWFMSAVGDPQNWDYAPVNITPSQAIAGNNSPLGLIGDVVTSLIAYTDDVLIFGCDHEIWMMRGDPMAGGQLDVVTKAVGMHWGEAYAMDPFGTIYFLSNRAGIYSLVPGQKPVRISQQIEQSLQDIDTGAIRCRFMWNDRFQGLHVFMSNRLSSTTATHFFWEQRSGAWWKETYTNPDHNPLAACTMDGNQPGDRVAVIGSWDGYVRSVSDTAEDDAGYDIASTVWIGPINSKDMDSFRLDNLQAVLGTDSGAVTYSVYVGSTPEAAFASTVVASGTWTAGRSLNTPVRRDGHAVYVKITSTVPWALEYIRAEVAGPLGKSRKRGR